MGVAWVGILPRQEVSGAQKDIDFLFCFGFFWLKF